MPFKLNLKYLHEVKASLNRFSSQLGQEVALVAIKKGATHMKNRIQAAAPVSSGGSFRGSGRRKEKAVKFPAGSLKRSIGVYLSRSRRDGSLGYYVLIGGRARMNPKGAYYARWVEYGYNTRSRLVSGKRAVKEGVITQEQYQALALRNIRQSLAKATPGKKVRIKRVSVRNFGKSQVQGKRFVERTFNSQAQLTISIIEHQAQQGLKFLARKHQLKTRG